MATKKATTTKYSNEEGFNFAFEPVEKSLNIAKTSTGYEARYLTPDDDADSPDTWEDDGLFLVNYHKQFWVENKEIVTENELRCGVLMDMNTH